MAEIKCPKCGEVFQVEEAGYAAIVGQVRNAEFEKELRAREKQFETAKNSELTLLKAQNQMEKEREIFSLRQEIEQLKSRIQTGEQEKALAVTQAVSGQKDELNEKDKIILQLQNRLQAAEKDGQLREQSLKENLKFN